MRVDKFTLRQRWFRWDKDLVRTKNPDVLRGKRANSEISGLPPLVISIRTKRAHIMCREGEVAGLVVVIIGKAKGGRPIRQNHNDMSTVAHHFG